MPEKIKIAQVADLEIQKLHSLQNTQSAQVHIGIYTDSDEPSWTVDTGHSRLSVLNNVLIFQRSSKVQIVRECSRVMI